MAATNRLFGCVEIYRMPVRWRNPGRCIGLRSLPPQVGDRCVVSEHRGQTQQLRSDRFPKSGAISVRAVGYGRLSGMLPIAVLDDGLRLVGLALVHTLLFATAGPQSYRSDDPRDRAGQSAKLRGDVQSQCANLLTDRSVAALELSLHRPQ